ncbi:non-ribosomal peptide synthetase [Streptomyces sp. JHA26]|uniref:non-ribosomal peptide synthetase n=1 Tax=Streptomyces sp. JHA26 TaxID=1917143 RepID=UPI00098A3BF9|nr:non-ribosomal peptide synthetase [Streptomyces sp. JHA26]
MDAEVIGETVAHGCEAGADGEGTHASGTGKDAPRAAEEHGGGSDRSARHASLVAEVTALLRRLLPAEAAREDTRSLVAAGVDSMSAARVVLEIQEELGVEVPLGRLSEPGGVPALADRIAAAVARARQDVHAPAGATAATVPGASGPVGSPAAEGSGPAQDAPEGPRVPAPGETATVRPDGSVVVRPEPRRRHEPFGLTALQEAYLVGGAPEFTADSVGCHLYREFEVDGLDPDRLRTALRETVRDHDMLRVEITDGRQLVRPTTPEAAELPFRVHETTEDDRDRQVRRIRDDMTYRDRAPGTGPLYAVEVSWVPDGTSVVHLDVDALLTDGRGLEVLLADWWRHYTGRPGRTAEPGTGRPSVRDYVTALLARRGTPAHRAALDHWRRRLDRLPPGPDLFGTPAGPGRRFPLTAELDAREWRSLRRRAAEAGVSPTSLLLTVFARVLGRGVRRPFSLVLTVSERTRLPAADGLIGPFTSNLVFPVPEEALGDGPVDEAAGEVHRMLWTDLGYTAVSGVEALRELRAAPALPVVFTSMLDLAEETDGFAAAPGYAVSQTSGVHLDHQLRVRDGRLRLRWDVNGTALPRARADRLFSAYVNALHLLAAERPEAARRARPNALQQSYYVARAGTGEPEGCHVHQSFAVRDLDLDRLTDAWLRMTAAYDVLRTTVLPDGTLRVEPEPPAHWRIPVEDTDGEAAEEAGDAGAGAGRTGGVGDGDVPADAARPPFPLGHGPHADLRVVRRADGSAVVHLTVDLAVADARSIHLLGRELWRLYADPAAAPRAAAEARPGRSGTPQEHREHWRRRLEALPAASPLMSGRPAHREAERRPPRRIRLETRLPGWGRVKKRAAAAGVTPDALLAAAFAEALAEAGGAAAEPFAFTVVRWPSWAEPARPGEYTALSWLPREPDGRTVWQRAAVYQRMLAEDAEADGAPALTAQRRRAARGTGSSYPIVYTSVFDLSDLPLPPGVTAGPWSTCTPDVSLDCVSLDDGDTLTVGWDAVPGDFPDGALRRAFDAFGTLCRELAADPPEEPGQRLRALQAWNDTARPFPAAGPAHTYFEGQAGDRPGHIALRWRGGTLSYGALNAWANRIAWTLRDHGVGPETVVAVRTPRGPVMVAAVLGVLKAGGAYLPVDTRLPGQRVAAMLRTAGAGLLLTADGAPPLTAVEGVTCVPADRTRLPDGPERRLDPPHTAGADNTAYVIFTSGSTGEPKGVAVRHRPVHNLLHWCHRLHGLGPDDTGLCVTSLGFDLSVFDILGLLGRGAGLYIADEEQQRDPELLLDVLVREPITFWNSAPTTLGQLLPLLPRYAGRPGTDDLRLVFLSGDYTPLPLPDAVRAVFRRARIVSLGGATEATVWSNAFTVDRVDPGWRSIPYGRPGDNARYYVLDERLRPCPPGAEGDLYIGGDCLADGYRARPALTAERFVPDPFGLEPGARMYRTGDRALWDDTGLLHFRGRADHQVKIRGFRVEPGEIEHRLRQHEAVRDAVVLARTDPSGDRRLVAYVQPSGDGLPATGELRKFAAAALPEYMVPNVIARVDTFPATPNGKLDREALPWPLPESGQRAQARGESPAGGTAGVTGGATVGVRAEERTRVTAGERAAEAEVRAGTADEVRAGEAAALPAGDGSGAMAGTRTAVTHEATAHGTDTRAADAGTAHAAAPGRAELREEIAALFAERLGVPSIDPAADLWDQGATSFTLAQVSTVLYERHGHRVPVSALLEDPSADAIAAHLARVLGTEEPPAGGEGRSPGAVPAGTAQAEHERPRTPPEETGTGAVDADEPEPVDFFSAHARAAFKAAGWARRAPAGPDRLVPLEPVEYERARYERRGARREFGRDAVGREQLTRLLALLRPVRLDDRERRLYPSAGDTYAVQVYLHVRPGRVTGMEAGLYHYRPEEHALELLAEGPGPDRGGHVFYNRPVFDAAAFELYLIGQLRGIAPLYGDDSARYLAVEAGCVAQLLMTSQTETGIGLCPVGARSVERLAGPLGLDDGHRFLLSFLGGPLPSEQHTPAAPAAPEPASRDARPHGRTAAEPAGRTAATGAARTPAAVAVAVTGAAVRLPGADGLGEFWRLLESGRSAVGAVPADRARALHGGNGRSRPDGGYLGAEDGFEPELFHIAPAEARTLDPQVRMVLRAVWECLENAGHTPESLSRAARRIGVFAGVMWHDHRQAGADAHRAGEPATLAALGSDIPNRVSHFFDFRGPSVAVDTSCSSSLTALHLAVEALRRGECDAAIAAGVNAIGHPYHLDVLTDLGVVATRPAAGAFDAASSGWSPGEGVGAVLLRRLEDAERDHDCVRAVVEATLSGHAGRAARYGAPRPQALADSLRHLLGRAGVSPEDIGYVECAAAGAGVADAAEIEALAQVFAARTERGLVLPVGTVKPVVGHLESAAGMSQLAKVLLQFEHRRIAATPAGHSEGLFSWKGLPVRLADRQEPWVPERPGEPLRALINAVGATGSYAHVVLREPATPSAAREEADGEGRTVR